MARSLVLCVALLLALAAIAHAAKSITLQVEPQTEECFFVDIAEQQLVTVQFTVSRGGKLDIYLTIVDPQGNQVHRELYFFDEHREDFMGNHQFQANQGTYSICFDNKMARYTLACEIAGVLHLTRACSYTAKVVSFKVSTPQNPVLQDLESSNRLENAAKKGTERIAI